MRYLMCLALLVVVGGSRALRPTPPAESLLDHGLDWTLAVYRALRSGPLALPVPAFRHPFVQGLVPGEVLASGGYFGDFTTLRRIGPVTGERNGTRLNLASDLAIENFAVGYRNYSVKFGESSGNGEMWLRAADNTLRLKVELDARHPWCTLDVSLVLTGVSGPEVVVLRLGDYNGLMDVLTDWAVGTFTERLVARANLALHRLQDRIASKFCDRHRAGLPPVPASMLEFEAGWDECILRKCAAFTA